MMDSAAFIIATKDRPILLRRLIKSISKQSIKPKQIIVVDASSAQDESLIDEFPSLPIFYAFSHPPSATRQRNEGLSLVSGTITHIGFIDDDALFEDDAFEAMDMFWKKAPSLVGGASFNLVNHPPVFAGKIKTHPLTERLGYYSYKKGAVLTSGFQTMIGTIDTDTEVQWLPTGAVVWRKDIFDTMRFDEWYQGYSYLEDLDFSYCVGKAHKLIVVSEAKYYHLPSPKGRGNDFEFGKKEVINRLYFVSKYPDLSNWKCYQVLLLRIILNSFMAVSLRRFSFIKRVLGNIAGLMASF